MVLALASLLLSSACGGGVTGPVFQCGLFCVDLGGGLFVSFVCPDCSTGGPAVDALIRVGQVANVSADVTVFGVPVTCATGIWSTTSPGVASVSGSGQAASTTGVAPGSTTISVQLDCGTNGAANASFILGVAAP